MTSTFCCFFVHFLTIFEGPYFEDSDIVIHPGGGSAVSGMDGITLTDMGGGWVLLPCDQIGADAIWTKNGQKMDKNGQK